MTEVIGTIVIILAAIIGLALLILGIPGTAAILIIVGIFAAATSFALITVKALLIMAAMMVAAEAIEFFAGYYGAKKYGSSRKAAIASIIGGVVGGIVGAPLGGGLFSVVTSFVGVFVGTFAGAFIAAWHESRNLASAGNVGTGAVIGRFMGLAAKVFLALAMVITALVSLFV